nr:MAG TPA: hypothetical protein [Caudoviricetes sp.]
MIYDEICDIHGDMVLSIIINRQSAAKITLRCDKVQRLSPRGSRTVSDWQSEMVNM